MSTDIGLARKQKVFAVAETTEGTLAYPSNSNMILPAGNAVMNQSPEFANSEELRNTLDVLDQFQNATPPGEWSVPMYARPSGTIGSVPQGDILFQSAFGSKNAATTAALSTNISAAATTITFDTRSGGYLPEHGVIQVGSEYIYYGGKTMSSATATTGTLYSLTRGYGGSTAATAATDDTLTLKSVFYKQEVSSPSFSLWIETDHFVQGMAGCSVNNLTIGVTNEGAVMLTFSGQGMQMVWAGSDAVATAAATAATAVVVSDADRYEAGAKIYNYTKSDDNSDSGYLISATNATSNKLTLSSGLTTNWAQNDVVKGYLPEGTEIGSPIESRKTTVLLDSVSSKFKSSDLTFGVPKQYITDEVGTEYPEDFVEDTRAITLAMSVYFRKADAKYFSEGYVGNEIPIELTFGDTFGSKMRVYMKRVKLTVPNINMTAPTVELSMDGTALGTVGEDSCDFCFE